MRKITIEQENMIPCFPKKFSFIPKENEKAKRKAEVQRNKFTIGNIYTLSGVECDDFEMPKKEYQLIDKMFENIENKSKFKPYLDYINKYIEERSK